MIAKRLARIILALVLVSAPASADTPRRELLAATVKSEHGRLVPALRDGIVVGLKVYAIEAGGRFAAAKLVNGDTLEKIDGIDVWQDEGIRAIHDNVIGGKADATLVVTRAGKQVTLQSKRR